MKLKTKKIIAKEILIFFTSLVVAFIIFGGTFGYNLYRQKQVNKIEKDIAQKTIIVDNLSSKNIDLKTVLQDYVATANCPKYNSDWNVINSKFPEFINTDKGLLQEYVATANSGKYKAWEEINSKFPELFPVKNSIDSISKKRTFKVNNDIYDIPIDKVTAFINKNPSSIELKSFIISKDTFNIPINDVQNFLLENPTAKPIYNFSQIDSISILRSDVSILKSKKCCFENKILTLDEQTSNSIIAFIIILLIVYPLRFLYFLVIWSVKTLRKNENQ